MRDWSPSLTGLLVGAAIGGIGRAAVVALHLQTLEPTVVPVLTWAAVLGAIIGGIAGLSGAPRLGAVLGALLATLAHVVMLPLALVVTMTGVATAPSVLAMIAVGALAGFTGGIAARAPKTRRSMRNA